MMQGSPSWSSDEYFRTESTDVDTTPHCDWIPGGWNNAWHTSNACDAIPGIACDGSGNVVSLKITEKVSLFHLIPTASWKSFLSLRALAICKR